MHSIACFCSERSAEPYRTYQTVWGPVRIIRCSGCGAFRADDVEDEAGMSQLYDESSIYKAPDEDEFREQQRSFEHVVHDLAKAGLRTGHVLDVGCASGYALAALKQAGWEVSGVERNRETAEYARRRLGATIVHDFADLPPTTRYDVVLLSHTLEHIPEALPFLGSIRARLKPTGTLFIKVPNYGSQLVRRVVRDRWNSFLPRQHVWYFDHRSLRRLLALAGFDAARVYSREHLGFRSRTPLRTLLKAPLAALHRLLPLDGFELAGIFVSRRVPTGQRGEAR